MQDLLIYITKGLSAVTTALRKEGKEICKEVNYLVSMNLFTTITNAKFDKDAIEKALNGEKDLTELLSEEYRNNLPETYNIA